MTSLTRFTQFLGITALLASPKARSLVKLVAMVVWLKMCLIFYTLRMPFEKKHPSYLNRFTYMFGRGVRKIIGVNLVFHDIEHMKSGPCVFVCNHQSGQDVVSFGAAGEKNGLYNVSAMFKKEIGNIPLIGWIIAHGGGVLVDRKNRKKAVDACDVAVQCIKDNRWSIIIAPEGTRYCETDQMRPLKKGPFYIAIQAGVPIVCLVQSSLRGKAVWEKLELGGGTVHVKALPPIDTKGMTTADVDDLMKTVAERMQTTFDELNAMQRAAESK